MIEQPVAYFSTIGGRKRGRESWVAAFAQYIAWAHQRGAVLVEVEVDEGDVAVVIDLCAARGAHLGYHERG